MVKYLDMSNNQNKNQINNEDCSCCFNKNTCSKCNYYWKDFDSGKGRVAFSYPAKNIKEGEVVCSMCYLEEEDKEDEEEDEEVRCICPDCNGEGWCFVSKDRAKELKKQELMEEACPFGDKCMGAESDKEDEEDEDEWLFNDNPQFYLMDKTHLDASLNPVNLDWSYVKPNVEYTKVYIFRSDKKK
tara:strand:- start:1044 stop:1601 length:558 start_codon:yes stop_codon:yes gene_type:complete